MTTIAVIGGKGSPGATTLALALAIVATATRHGDALLVEADPAGGDIAARCGIPLDPGLLTLAASGRRGLDQSIVERHAQRLPCGVLALVGPTSDQHATTTLAAIGGALGRTLETAQAPVVIDAGRWDARSPAAELVAFASVALLVLRPTIEGVEHARYAARLSLGPRTARRCREYRSTPLPAGGGSSRTRRRTAHRCRARPAGRKSNRHGRAARSLAAPFTAPAQFTRACGAPSRCNRGNDGHTMNATDIDVGLVKRIRSAVASELTVRVRTAELEGTRRLQRDDEIALARELVNTQLEELAREAIAHGSAAIDVVTEEALAAAVFDHLFQFGRLQPLLDDQRIQNIVANGCDQVFIEYADGTKIPGPRVADSDADLIETLREIGRRYGLSEREFNPSRPALNLQLPDGSRLFAIAWVCDRPAVAIRRHRFMKVTLQDLVRLGAIDAGLQEFLAAAVRARKQIIVAGATGAGKTTMLRALAAEIPPDERIVTIETELELGLDRFPELHPDVVALEAREANVEGAGEVTAAELVRMSLRMNPDRVIVGEVRGEEIIPMLNAMSQGNDGSMCTVHADSSGTVFNKLALYAMQAPERLPLEATNQLAAAAIDLVVFIAKTRDGRFVASVRQVVDADGRQVVTNELFTPGRDGRAVPGIPLPHDLAEDLAIEGYDLRRHERPEGWWQ